MSSRHLSGSALSARAFRTTMTALALLTMPGLAFAGAERVWSSGNPRDCYEDVSGARRCATEGENHVSNVCLDAKGGKPRVNGDGRVSVRQRCHDTQATSAPVVNRAEIAQTVANAAALAILLGVLGKSVDETTDAPRSLTEPGLHFRSSRKH